MKIIDLENRFKNYVDVFGIIQTKTYLLEAKKQNRNIPDICYPTMVVVGIAYPMRMMKHSKTHLAPSFYTFGSDYHQVLKTRIQKALEGVPFKYELGVDNHQHDERLAATLAGIGYFGKNQLIINKDFGTYIFLGIAFLDVEIEHELKLPILDDCGTCRKCISACPTKALSDEGFQLDLCMSQFNQTKKVLSDLEIEQNVSLFGCDICQMVCPKNMDIKKVIHPEFELSGKEMVSIMDLFTLSEKKFKEEYRDMSYLWKGKTILMRNALTLLYKQKNMDYLELIEKSIDHYTVPWYRETAIHILDKMKALNVTTTMSKKD